LLILEKDFALANLKMPENMFSQSGSLQGVHTEHLGFMLAEMQFLQRAYPDAVWD
jgi:ring-1,2-phenylacetyl-CoA epoxidase subunit PaaC